MVEENGKCWCECPAEWNGDSDCSKRTAEPKPVAASDKCEFHLSLDSIGARIPRNVFSVIIL